MNAALRARLEFAAGKLERTAKTVGVPGAVQGAHVAGPTRGHSVVVLGIDLVELLREVLAADAAPVESSPAPVTSATPSNARFRNLEMD